MSALLSLHPLDGRVNPILYPVAELRGPARDGLRGTSDRARSARDGASKEGDGGFFVHGTPLNHGYKPNTTMIPTRLCKVAVMEFGDRLAHALVLADESRDGLAKSLGISVQAIGMVINGVNKALTAENTVKAARHLRVSAYWLATGKEQPRGSQALREMISEEALSYAIEFDAMTDTEKEQFKMLLAVAIEGRRHLGGMSNFGDIAEG